jgi:hypothetical protein
MAGLVLGGISFTGFEIPNQINFGGEHNLAVHELIGGTRVIDAMGSKPDPISWSGRFRGPNAIARAQAVDELRIGGNSVGLAWLNLSRSVVVRQFKADTEKPFEVPYQITCEVVSESAASRASVFQSIDTLMNNDLLAAGGFVASSAAQAVLATLGTSLAAAGPIAGSTAAARTSASQALNTAKLALQAIGSGEASVLGKTMPQGSAIALANWLSAQANAAQDHTATVDVLAYVKRIGVNVAMVKS